ncbi:hypothetical protein DV735_g2985, partial [Chaetothyriales sp. CBS 134920]
MVSASAATNTPSPKGRRNTRLSLSAEASTDASLSPYPSGLTDGTLFSGASSRTSQTSLFPPASPVTHRRRKSSRASIGSIVSTTSYVGDNTGLGNLADELAEADVDEEHGTLSPAFLADLREGDLDEFAISEIPTSPYADPNDMTPWSPQEPRHRQSNSNSNTTPTSATFKRNRRSKSAQGDNTALYDGSDYGPESDSEDGRRSGLPPLLAKRIRSIERLVRESTDRGEEALLGPTQANIEYGVTRLLTACNSIATYRTHAQRDLFSSSHALMYGHWIHQLPTETLDQLASELEAVFAALPVLPSTTMTADSPHQNPLVSLSILANNTNSLINTLRSLTDLLQETRLAANAATRQLKTVRDMVEELRLDDELVENSMLLIQAGDWDRRCRERQAARVCREVVHGFGERWGIEVAPSG